ncbi:MAG TPA: PKD domain-containing protein [Bacteroidales bacterium]|nr:PKD domain-containing protein [Bacteroidales bacterium]
MIRLKYLLLSSLLLLTSYLNIIAQNFLINDGGIITITSGSKLYLNGDLINQNVGIFINEDTIYLTGNIINTASNNLFQNSGNATVIMAGANQQIDGTSIPHFNNLSLDGSGTKYLNTDVRIKGQLNLKDKEFNISNHTLYIDNIDTSAIIRTYGYINCNNSGFITRAIAQQGNYVFPTGSPNLNSYYRPVIITSPNANPDTFKVKLVDYDATIDGFDINNKENTICLVNSNFYHHIERKSSNLGHVQLTFFFDSLTDGAFDKITHWQGTPAQWQNTAAPSSLIYLQSPQLSQISIIKWNNFNPPSFALAISGPDPTISFIHQICQNSSPQTLTANTPGGIWSGPGIIDSINGIFDPQITGPGTFTIYYNVSSANACVAKDSASITVEAPTIPSFYANINGNNVNFINNSLNATTYYWDFGDGDYSNATSPTHTYNSAGNYTVILYTSNSCGTDSISQNVNISTVGISENTITNNIYIAPNPFNENATLFFSIQRTSKIKIDLYNVTGEKISTILPQKLFKQGNYSINIYSSNVNYTPGVYILHMYLDDELIIKRIVFI